MKLLRVGDAKNEKPAILDKDNNFRDLSSLIHDFSPDTLNFETLDKIKKINILNLPIIGKEKRIG